jgi:hypothetical protein
MTSPLPEAAPWPPAELGARKPLEVTLETGEVLHRFYTAAFDPIYFDRGREGRLNAPDDAYGVLYVAKAPQGAFAETFLRTPGLTQLPTDLLARKAYAKLKVLRPLRLVRLAGPGLARLGATAQVVHGGKPYDTPQAWSGALHAHPGAYDGIAYNARHDDEALCYAIFERAADGLQEVHRETDLDQDWVWDLAEPYGVGLPPA